MYTVVLMMALQGGAEVPDFGRRCQCSGCSCYCSRCSGCHGCCGGRCHGCRGSCRGCRGGGGCYGCHGCRGCRGCYGCSGCCGGTAPARSAMSSNQTQSIIVVNLPADARLTIDGQPTSSSSATRSFVTPPLEPGPTYGYSLSAEITRNGRRTILTQQVTFAAGEEKRVSFEFPSLTSAPNR
jgi:uncharacterized protein (TIGR03000 family)